jgi:hypothetical protein
MRLRPQRFAQRAVTSLCIEGDVQPSTAADILSLCRDTTSLALWIAPSDFPDEMNSLLHSLNALPLMTLSLSISLIFNHSSCISLSTIPVFRLLSHLEILNIWVLWGSAVGLQDLDRLTHLCLHVDTQRTKPALVKLLLNNLRFRIFVFRVSEDYATVQKFLEQSDLIDPRIVLVHRSRSDLRADDMSLWRNAERIVERRYAN